jgi:HD-like signal output (HDOD) protein
LDIDSTPQLDLDRVLGRIDSLAAQRPVAAQLIAAADTQETDARRLSGILAGDVALSGRVMKLANSAYFGMRGRVTSLQFAVTVVGFTTVRTMATIALTDLDDETRLPEDFWEVSTRLSIAASLLAPKCGEKAADALCLGVLAPLGSALLYQDDRGGYAQLLEAETSFAGRRTQERARYGMSAIELTAVALETWGFPDSMILPLQRIDDRASPAGALLRASYEVVSRLTIPDHRAVPIGLLTRSRVREDDLPEVLYTVHNQAADLRLLLIGE